MVVLCIGSACITGICVKWASQYDPEQRSYDPVVLSKTVPVKLPACAVGWGQYNNSFAWLCCSKLERRKKQKFKVWYKKFFKKVGNTGYLYCFPCHVCSQVEVFRQCFYTICVYLGCLWWHISHDIRAMPLRMSSDAFLTEYGALVLLISTISISVQKSTH